MLFVSETELDMSFPSIQFSVPGCKCHRGDRMVRTRGLAFHLPLQSSQQAQELDVIMMTSSNGNSFRVAGHLRGEFTGHR